MNIFVLDLDPILAAQYHADIHCGKMILESAQLLCTAHHTLGSDLEEIPYKPISNPNHPCAKWVRESHTNYNWLIEMAFALGMEYEVRYKKKHKSSEVIKLLLNSPLPKGIPYKNLTNFALAMPDQYKVIKNPKYSNYYKEDPVTSYRQYYIGDKLLEKNIISYSKIGNVPEWFKDMSAIKRALELPKNDPLRKQVEAFMSGEPLTPPKPKTLSVKKGDVCKIKGSIRLGKIIKYSSNKEIWIGPEPKEIKGKFIKSGPQVIRICKEDIVEIIN